MKQLRHFLAVAEAGGISAAARRLAITQPALSRQIKALEDELGVTLLDRGARSFSLTPAAETLVTDGRKLLEFHDAMCARVRHAAAGLPLRIGYAPSLAGDFLPLAIANFSQLHPKVRVSLRDSSSMEMRRDLLAGKLDLLVGAPGGAADEIAWTTLRECGWLLAVSPRHRLASARTVAPGDLRDERIVLFEREHYPDYWQRVTGFFKLHGIQAKLAGEFDGITSLTAAVEADMGCAIIAETSRPAGAGDARLVLLPLEPPPEPIIVAAGVPARHQPPPHVLAFIEELKLHVAGE